MVIWNIAPDTATATAPQPAPTRQQPHAARNILRVFPGHTRTITDLDWSPHHPDLIASAGFDSWIQVWDMRVPGTAPTDLPPLPDHSLPNSHNKVGNPVASFCPFSHGAPLVVFSRHDPNQLASSHHTDLHIWDLRKPNTPDALYSVRSAHALEIRGIDWSLTPDNRLVSCGQDRTIRIWDLSEGTARMVEGRGLEYAAWKCRWTPLGEGFVILPFGNDRSSLYLYPRKDEGGGAPLAAFQGHEEAIVDFVYRPRGNDTFEVLSWGLDETLRVWEVPKKAMDALTGKPVTVEEDSVGGASPTASVEEPAQSGVAEIVEHFRSEAVERGAMPADDDDDEVAWLREAFGGGDSDSEDEQATGKSGSGNKKLGVSLNLPLQRQQISLAAEIDSLRKAFPAVRIVESESNAVTVYIPTTRIPEGLFLAEVYLPDSNQPARIDLTKTTGWTDLPPSTAKMLEATCRGLAKYYGRAKTGCLESLVKYLGGDGSTADLEMSEGEAEMTSSMELLPRQEERYVPFPRLSGASFGRGAAGDVLVRFGSPLVGRLPPLHPRDFGGYTAMRQELLREVGAPAAEISSTVSNASSDDEGVSGRRRTRRRKRQHRPPQLPPTAALAMGFANPSPLIPNLLVRMQRHAAATRELALLSSARNNNRGIPFGRGSRRPSFPDAGILKFSGTDNADLDGITSSMGSDTAPPSPPQKKLVTIAGTAPAEPRSPPVEPVQELHPHLRGMVQVSKVSAASFADESVARASKTSGSSPLAVCLHNQMVAVANGDFEGAGIWALAGILLARCQPGGIMKTNSGEFVSVDSRGLLKVDDRVDEGVDVGGGDEDSLYSADILPGLSSRRKGYAHWTRVAWRSHPLARQLVANALEALYKKRDVQTLSMLVCVLSEKKEEDDPLADLRRLDAANKEFEVRYNRISTRLQRIDQKRLSEAPTLPFVGTPEPEQSYFPIINARHVDVHSPGRGSTASSARSSVVDYPLTEPSSAKFGTSPSLTSTLLGVFGGGGGSGSGSASHADRTSPVPSTGTLASEGLPTIHTDMEHAQSAAIALPRRPIPHRTHSLVAPPGSSILSSSTMVGSPLIGGNSLLSPPPEAMARTSFGKQRTSVSSMAGASEMPSPRPRTSITNSYFSSSTSLSSSLPKPLMTMPRPTSTSVELSLGGEGMIGRGNMNTMPAARISRNSSAGSAQAPRRTQTPLSIAESVETGPTKSDDWGLRRVAAFGEFPDEEMGWVCCSSKWMFCLCPNSSSHRFRHLPIVLANLSGSISIAPTPSSEITRGQLVEAPAPASKSFDVALLARRSVDEVPAYLPDRRPSAPLVPIRQHRASVASITSVASVVSDVSARMPSWLTEVEPPSFITAEVRTPSGRLEARDVSAKPKAPSDLPLLPYPFPAKYVACMVTYAEMLLAWGMLKEHAWVLKHLDPFSSAGSGSGKEALGSLGSVQLEPVCSRCGDKVDQKDGQSGEPGERDLCGSCQTRRGKAKPLPLCVLCGKRVGRPTPTDGTDALAVMPRPGEAQQLRSIGSFCAVCGHGGHQSCMESWFGPVGGGHECPAGCGCECLLSWS